MRNLVWLAISVTALGCGDKGKGDDMADYRMKTVSDAIAKVRPKVKAGIVDRMEIQTDCRSASTIGGAGKQPSKELTKLLGELDALCNYGLGMLDATAKVAATENARAAQPEGDLPACNPDDWSMFATRLDRDSQAIGIDAAWVELKARWAKVCPPD